MSRFSKAILVAGLMVSAAAVLFPQQTTRLIRVSFETLIGPAIGAPGNPPSGFHEIFFDEDNSNHTTRIAPDGSLHDLEATGSVVNSCPACTVILDVSIKGGWIGNLVNSAITANQSAFNTSVPYRFDRDYVIGAPYTCSETSNDGIYKQLWWYFQNAGGGGATTTPQPIGYPYVLQESGAAAGCVGNPAFYVFAPELTYAYYNQGVPASVSSSTNRGWAGALYGAKVTPMYANFSNTIAGGATNYTNHNFGSLTTTESETAMPVASNGEIGNLSVFLDSAQPGTGALTFTLRKNTTTDVCTLGTIPSSGAARLWKFNTTCAVTEGDSFDIKIGNAAGTASGRVVYAAWQFISTDSTVNGWIPFPNNSGLSLNGNNDNFFYPFITQSGTSGTTENVHRFPMARDAIGKKLYCYASNTPGATVNMKIYKNGSVVTTLAYNTSGTRVQGTSSTVSFDDTDAYDLNIAVGTGTVPTRVNCMWALE